MADKRYQLTFTDTTWKVITSLKRTGHDIRDVLNTGIILYDRASTDERYKAYVRAKSKLPEEIDELERRLAIAKKEKADADAADVERLLDDAEGRKGERANKKPGKTSKSA